MLFIKLVVYHKLVVILLGYSLCYRWVVVSIIVWSLLKPWSFAANRIQRIQRAGPEVPTASFNFARAWDSHVENTHFAPTFWSCRMGVEIWFLNILDIVVFFEFSSCRHYSESLKPEPNGKVEFGMWKNPGAHRSSKKNEYKEHIIWANYNNSLTWIVRPFWDDSSY